MTDTLETLFAHIGRAPTFEQVFGDKSAKRLPTVCCVTGTPIRMRKDSWTRYGLGNGYSVFAKRRLTEERRAALAALLPVGKSAKVVKETNNG